uniref:PKHD1 ciliary IPT domain containing fibrocystin/polyductin n=1 Tax=Terrapene triunguis TaxID=2587831 RepID=A0A674IUB9_9SAUR
MLLSRLLKDPALTKCLLLMDCLGLTSPQLQSMYSTNGSLLEVSLVNPILPPVRCDVHPVYFDVSIIRCKTRYGTLLKGFRKDFLGRRCCRKPCEDVFLLFSECVTISLSLYSYPIQMDHGTGTLQCRVEGSYIGVSQAFLSCCRSMVHKDAWLISAKQELFLYQTFSEIASVFPVSGSLGGGSDLTITGDFFDQPVQVTVAGVPCEIKHCSPRKISCTTGPIDETRRLVAPQAGNRGLLFEVWDDAAGIDLTETAPGYRWQIVPNASSPERFLSQAQQSFSSRLRGFFVAPQTNNYTFWIQADGRASLHLSLSEDPGKKVKVAFIPAGASEWSEHWEKNWSESWQPKSQKFELMRGSKYYLEALHHGKAPSSGMRVGVQLHNTWLNPDVVNTYRRERHEIRASAHRLPEIQMLTLSGTGWFRISWDNVSSNMMATNATADQVQTVIEELLSVKCETEPLSAKFLLRNGFEEGQRDSATEGHVASWTEPFCGRFSIHRPKHLVKMSPSTLPRYNLTEYTHVCFAYKGYMSDTLYVSVSYINTFLNTVKKNLTCLWSLNETSPESWKFTCADLWRGCVNGSESLRDLEANSPVFVHQIDMLIPEREEETSSWFYLDEIIVSDRNVAVFQRDPRPARPGGNVIQEVSVVGSPSTYNVSFLVAGCGSNLPLLSPSLTVQRLQAASPPIGGTFRILLPNTVISGVPVHVSSHHLRELLQSNSDNSTGQYLNASDFTVTKDVSTCYQNVWTLTWNSMTGDLPIVIDVSAENLTGLNPTIAARVVYDGGVFIGPIFGDMLATANNHTQVGHQLTTGDAVSVQTLYYLHRLLAVSPGERGWGSSCEPRAGLTVPTVSPRVVGLQLSVPHNAPVEVLLVRMCTPEEGRHLPLQFCGRWSKNSSWLDGHLPQDGANVTVERGQTLLLDTTTGILNLLHVKGGKLLLAGPGPIEIHAHYILVSDGGKFQVGSPDKPLRDKAHIHLYGSFHSATFFPYGAKFLAVRNGTVSMHGWVPEVVFTHLKSAACVNDSRIFLEEPVDWQPGDEVIVSGTGPGDTYRQEEIVTIEAVNNTELYLRSPLRYPHSSGEEWVHGQRFALKAVVALLSRRIVVRGNLTRERMSHLRECAEAGVSGDASACLYKRSERMLGSRDMGAVVIVQAFQGEDSHIHLEGVQFQHVGQAFQQQLSALTIAGDAHSYICSCSVWDSFGRGLSLSRTSELRVDNNVFYNILGHGILLELYDVIFKDLGNRVRHNTVIGLSGTDGLSNIETLSPAGIYIRAPANQIEANTVCAAGYGYFFHLSPEGPSQTPLLAFSKNTAHSCTRYGLLVYPEYQPKRADGLGPVLFQSFTAWRNQGGAQIFSSRNLELRNFQIYACKDFGIDIVESLGNTTVANSLLLGHLGQKDSSCMSAGLKTPQRHELLVSNTSFMNFDISTCTAISTCSGCYQGQGGFTVRAEQLAFLNSPNQASFPFPHSAILGDLDGSLTGQEGSHLLASMDTLAASCVASANFSHAARGSVCGRNVIFHRMSIGLKEAPDFPYNLTVTDSNNKTTIVPYVSDTLSNPYGWMALLLDQETYTLTFGNPFVSKQLQYSATFDNFIAGNYLLVEHENLPSYVEVMVFCGTRPGQLLQSLPSHDQNKGCDWFFNSKLRKLTYLVTGEDLVQVTLKGEERIPLPAPVSPPDIILKWSFPESWSGVKKGWGGYNHSIPAPGEDVIILPNRTILVDTTLPPLRGLYILGTLEFPVNSSNVLSATCIVVAGGELKVGTFQHPLERGMKLLILLRASEGVYCDRLDGISVHPGTVGVYGKVQIHSAYPRKSWTHLGSDIAPGNERIWVEDEVDWSPGGNIVISSSSYDAHQAEVVTLKEINGHSIRFQERLLHRHIGRSHSIEDGRRVPLAAEVGLLTRNIQIKSDMACSGRLLVGRFRNTSGTEFAGDLRLSNIEILNFGPSQLPAIGFSNIALGSSIISSSIHHSCGGGIQAVTSSGISLRDNVVFNTVGPGIDLEGQTHSLIRNLIILSKQPEGLPNWVAGIKVNKIDGSYLLGNVVAGSERIAFHIRGQECFLAGEYCAENVAHSSLHGVHLYRGDGFQNCTKITGFLSYKNYDYGVMFQLESSVVMDNMMLVDNAVGVLPVVYSPSAKQYRLGKKYIEFRNSVIIATSSTFDCIKDRIMPLSANLTSRDRAPYYPQRGRIGILWPSFASEPSQWPDNPWHKIRNYAAVSGIMKLQEVTFTGFTKSCYSDDRDVCIMSNPDSVGIMYPITAEMTRMLHVHEQNKFYFHTLETRCEGSRKALFKDLDGSALGLQPPVSVFPKSKFEWTESCLHAGIYREDTKCIYKPSTQGYFCKDTDHALVILESLDTEADGRTSSPVVSVTGSFVEAFSSGVSRVSCCPSEHPPAFYSVLPSNKLTKVCFTGLTPPSLRLRLISGQNSTRLLIAIFYDEPRSLHVFMNGNYIPLASSSSSAFLTNAMAGAHSFSFENNLLYILLHGDDPIEIYTSFSLHAAFTIAETIGEEGQRRVVHRLADFLQIGRDYVRIVQSASGSESTLKVISDNVGKRTRECPPMTPCTAFSSRAGWEKTRTGAASVWVLQSSHAATPLRVLIIEIGEPPGLFRNKLVPSLLSDRLKSLASTVINAQQTGDLQRVLELPIDTLMVTQSAGIMGNGSSLTPGGCLYVRPYNISVLVQPSDGEMEKELPEQPQIIFLDKQGRRVEALGLPSEPWVMTACLKGSSEAVLKGHTRVEVRDGRASFTNLAISNSGSNWYLIFTVISPPGADFTVESQPFTIFPIPKGEKSITVLAAVLGSVASVLVMGLLVFCWSKKSKSFSKWESPGELSICRVSPISLWNSADSSRDRGLIVLGTVHTHNKTASPCPKELTITDKGIIARFSMVPKLSSVVTAEHFGKSYFQDVMQGV